MANMDSVFEALERGAEKAGWACYAHPENGTAHFMREMPGGMDYEFAISLDDYMEMEDVLEFLEESVDSEIEKVNTQDYVEELRDSYPEFEEDEGKLWNYANTALNRLNMLNDYVQLELIILESQEMEAPSEESINVLLVSPGKAPELISIANELSSLQEAVEGNIETAHFLREGAVIICNEEGKLDGLPASRVLFDGDEMCDAICGDFLIAGDTGEDFASLDDEQVSHYKELFADYCVDIHDELHEEQSLDDVIADASERADAANADVKSAPHRDEQEL